MENTPSYTDRHARDWQGLDERADALDDLAWAAVEGSHTWTEVGDEIKAVGGQFKSVRYPTREDRQAAWERFQRIVENIKERQENLRSVQRGVASTHRDRLIWHISNATVVGFEGVFGEPSRDELMYKSEEMREGWRYFEAHKDEFGGEEKSELYGRLRETQDALDRAWARFKGQAATLREQQREEVEARIQRHQRKLAQLNEALERMKAHRYSLEERLGRTHRKEKLEEIQGWIEDIDMRIEEKERIIQGIEEWLERDLEKVQRS